MKKHSNEKQHNDAQNDVLTSEQALDGVYGGEESLLESAKSAGASGEEKPKRLAVALVYAVPAAFFAAFLLFAFFSRRTGAGQLALAGASTVFFGWLAARLIRGHLGFIETAAEPAFITTAGERSRTKLHPVFKLICASLIAQIAVIATVYALDVVQNGMNGTIIRAYPRLFITSRGLIFGENTRTIASSLGLASFVLPDSVERIVANSWLALPVFAANTLCVAALTVLTYELLIIDNDKKTAKFGASLLYATPAVLLLLQPLGGTSYFMLLSMLSLLLARRKKLLWSGACALLACFFNIFGALLAIMVVIEGAAQYANLKRNLTDNMRETPASCVIKTVFGSMLPLAVCCLGVFYSLYTSTGLQSIGADNSVFFFETLGRLIFSKPVGTVGTATNVLTIVVLAAFAAVVFLRAKGKRISHIAFCALFLMLSPSLIAPALGAYSVFSCPALPALIAPVGRRRPVRAVITLLFIIFTLLFIALFFVKRTA